MAAGLAAAHAEQDVLGTEPAMHPNGLVRRDDALGEIGVEQTRGRTAVGVPVDPFQELRVGEECRLDLSRTLEIAE
jgi:hypothetical protein